MTAPVQLELVPQVRPRRGTPLFAVRLPVEPFAWMRPGHRAMRLASGRYVAHAYNETAHDAWLDKVALLIATWWREPPIAELLVARATLVFPRPDGPKVRTVKGVQVRGPWGPGRIEANVREDYDNLVKIAWDAAVQGGLLLDDSLIVRDGGSAKVYAAEGETPCVELHGWALG